VKLSLSQISTPNASLADGLAAYAAAGFEGIGLWEFSLTGDDEADRAAVRASGLEVTNCVPLLPTILPNPVLEGPEDPDERIASICASVRRFAGFEPGCVLVLTGPSAGFGDAEARRIVTEGLRLVAHAADEAGVRLGLEPITAAQPEFSFVHSVPAALELLEEAGLPGVGIMFDTFNLGETETVLDDIAAGVGRFTGVHVAELPVDEADGRVLPGEGVARARELVAALAAAGWNGYLDVEIFSTPEGFWAIPVEEAARRAYAAGASLLA